MYNILIDKKNSIIHELLPFLKEKQLYDEKQKQNIITWGLPKKVKNNYIKKKKLCKKYKNHIILERGFFQRNIYYCL